YFYRLLGHYDMAIDILENAEYCGLDSTEQVYLNELKFDISEENALRSYGYRAILMDTVFTDSSSYTVPGGSGQKPYLFRSTLNDVDDISFDPGCGYKPYSYDVDEPTINFEVYPNPNDGT